LADIWDGQEVKLNFRRNFFENIMSKWLDPVEIVSVVQFSQEGDALLWAYESSRIYSTHSIYAIINFRGGATSLHPMCVEN